MKFKTNKGKGKGRSERTNRRLWRDLGRLSVTLARAETLERTFSRVRLPLSGLERRDLSLIKNFFTVEVCAREKEGTKRSQGGGGEKKGLLTELLLSSTVFPKPTCHCGREVGEGASSG